MPEGSRNLKSSLRIRVDEGIDWLRFQLDTRPRLNYQPLPWLGKPKASRSEGTETRWAQIDGLLANHEVATAMDIGANVGWFSIQLSHKGIQIIAVEFVPKYLRTILFARDRLHLNNLSLMALNVDEESVVLLPHVDATLFLAVWHHIVRYRGIVAGDTVLREVWNRTGKVLFFEAGEEETPSDWGLPSMSPTADAFFRGYLEDHCPEGRILHLGKHVALGPSGPCERTLWAVVRNPESASV